MTRPDRRESVLLTVCLLALPVLAFGFLFVKCVMEMR